MSKQIERRFSRIWAATMVAFGAISNLGIGHPARTYPEVTEGFRGDQTRIARDFYVSMRKIGAERIEKAQA